MATIIRDKIRVGNLVNYKRKEYIIIRIDFECGGNIMLADMIRCTPDWGNKIKLVRTIYDEQIEQCKIIG